MDRYRDKSALLHLQTHTHIYIRR